MGSGLYSHEAHVNITRSQGTLPVEQVFQQTDIHPLMDPYKTTVRESRDSADHPQSLAVCMAVDLTGSMKGIPTEMAQKYLPNFMQGMIALGVSDPQVMFMGVGDTATDRHPFQVGQFESTAELVNAWLTRLALGICKGGGNDGESYHLAMRFLADKTAIDCFDLRGIKGFAFLTGDDGLFVSSPAGEMTRVFGDIGTDRELIKQIIADVSKKYHLFFVIPDRQRAAERLDSRHMTVAECWRELLGDRVLVAHRPEDICDLCALAVAFGTGMVTSRQQAAEGLKALGRDRNAIGRIVSAIEPYVASLGLAEQERPVDTSVSR